MKEQVEDENVNQDAPRPRYNKEYRLVAEGDPSLEDNFRLVTAELVALSESYDIKN